MVFVTLLWTTRFVFVRRPSEPPLIPYQDGATTRHLPQESSTCREFYSTLAHCIYLLADRMHWRGLFMHHAPNAECLCGSRQGCLKGIRKEVLLQIKRWLVDKKDQRMFRLNGLAATGKSTIARTFAEISFADGKRGASFFCSRDFEDRSNLQVIFPTLAFQLAYRYLEFRERLLKVLKASPDVGRESLSSQISKGIV